MKSIIQDCKECFLCRKLYGIEGTINLEEHHIFEGGTNGRRAQSEKYGLKVYLCYLHHRDTHYGVHFNAENDLIVKTIGQEYFEAKFGSRDVFREIFQNDYLSP